MIYWRDGRVVPVPLGECGGLARWIRQKTKKPVEASRSPDFEIVKKMFDMYSTYILKSEKNGKHYYGHSQNPETRLKDHNNGRVRSTKAHRPWKIIYVEKFKNRVEAREREFFFKTLEGYQYLKQRKII